MIERAPNKRIRDIDWGIVLIVAVLAILSVVMVSSATRVNITGDPSYFYIRQTLWFVIGFAAMFLAIRIDYAEWEKRWKSLYGAGVCSLALVNLAGSAANGARSWFQLGPLKLEPAEFMKLVLILVLSRLLKDCQASITYRQLARILLLAAIPIGLVILQPDLGTAMMMSAIVCGMLWSAGIPRRHLLGLSAIGVSFVGLLLLMYVVRQDLFFAAIQPYQWERLTMFLNPETVKSGAGYQLYQSMLAIGAGQWFGEGVYRGSQTQGAWIPERHTDFIFSVIAEELGFLGAGFLLVSYCILLVRMAKIGREARDNYGSLVVAGVL
ncbi:FtsW/RodA/SpoVE family cell cycle protein, partial [Effusibacillus lacus]